MKENMGDKTPHEIPTRQNPDRVNPTKDPMAPSKNNPINPKTDEPGKRS